MRDHDPEGKEKKEGSPAPTDSGPDGGPPDLSGEPLPDREEWRERGDPGEPPEDERDERDEPHDVDRARDPERGRAAVARG